MTDTVKRHRVDFYVGEDTQGPHTVVLESDYLTLADRLREAEIHLFQYYKAFHHYHVNSQDGTDSCKQCGLDLRNPIHTRLEQSYPVYVNRGVESE